MACVVAVCISKSRGERKTPVSAVELAADHGILGDAHAGPWQRQISLLTLECIQKMQCMGLDVTTGDFSENIITSGIDLVSLPIGTRLAIGDALVEITQIGTPGQKHRATHYTAGECVLPKEGVFASVLKGGTVFPNDLISVRAAFVPITCDEIDLPLILSQGPAI